MYGKTEIVPFLQYGIYSYDSPKKEFPGLRELLINLTKKSRYRFIVKNRSKKSKTRLHHIIKNLLENGKVTKDTKSTANNERSAEVPPMEQNQNFTTQSSQNLLELKASQPSKNVEYLKPPSQVGEEKNNKQPFNYEYPQPEYKKSLPSKDQYMNEFAYNYQKPVDFYCPNYPTYPPNGYDGKLQAVYSNPKCSESEYSHFGYYNKKSHGQMDVPRVERPLEMSKAYSLQLPPEKSDKIRGNNLLSKSVDKNWKQNNQGVRHYNPSVISRKYSKDIPPLRYPSTHNDGEVCAFDTRDDTISQYSRFNKSFFNKPYLEQPQLNSQSDNDYLFETKRKSYDYLKPSGGPPHGFLLSPEDLQSWVETFDDKIYDAQGKPQYTLKRSTVP